jgi:hypothetical protein
MRCTHCCAADLQLHEAATALTHQCAVLVYGMMWLCAAAAAAAVQCAWVMVMELLCCMCILQPQSAKSSACILCLLYVLSSCSGFR